MASQILTGMQQFQSKWIERAKGRTLVVGAKCYDKPDRRELYENAIGIDLEEGDGVDFVHDLEQPLPDSVGRFNHIDCCSVLEHVKRPWLMAQNIETAMEPGATILLTVPFTWRLHAYPSDYWRISAEALEVLFPLIEWEYRKYAINDKLKCKVHGKVDVDGHWMARSELVAFGSLCK